jgi:hypothetical protein
MSNSPPNAWPSMPLVAPVSPAELTLWQAGIEWSARANWRGGEIIYSPVPTPPVNEHKPTETRPLPAP